MLAIFVYYLPIIHWHDSSAAVGWSSLLASIVLFDLKLNVLLNTGAEYATPLIRTCVEYYGLECFFNCEYDFHWTRRALDGWSDSNPWSAYSYVEQKLIIYCHATSNTADGTQTHICLFDARL